MSRIKQFKELEKRLEKKIENKPDNQVILEPIDFKNGKLSVSGYNRLRQECEYIDYVEDIEIFIPSEFAGTFSSSLEGFAATELSQIKKDRRDTQVTAMICLLFGLLWFSLGHIFNYTGMLKEITIIATWVFVWTAIEKLFFNQNKLRDRRFGLLQILSAKVTIKQNNN